MNEEELKALLEKANANYEALKVKLDAGDQRVAGLESINEKLTAKLEALESKGEGVTQEQLEELKNEMADLEVKTQRPAVMMTKEDEQKVRNVLKTALGAYVKTKDNNASMNEFVDLQVKAALNLTNTGEGLESIDEVLSRDIIERAREAYPLLSDINVRNMPRKLREQVLISYPSVQLGIENVAGADISETDVQRYAEVENNVAKVNAKPRITDEALVGGDLDIYGHLLSLLDDEIGRWLILQVLFGDNSGKSMRGILSSNRLDITNTTGQAWKETIAASDARDPDHYPAVATGVAGGLPATDNEIIDFMIDVTEALPTKYLGNAKWYFNRKLRAKLRKVKDADGRPQYTNDNQGDGLKVEGYPIVIEDYMPDYTTADAPFAIFGDLNAAFSMSPGDIDKMLLDPYSVDGCVVVKTDKEFFEIVGKNDAIIILVATTNS